jgi:hypothetical protein
MTQDFNYQFNMAVENRNLMGTNVTFFYDKWS